MTASRALRRSNNASPDTIGRRIYGHIHLEPPGLYGNEPGKAAVSHVVFTERQTSQYAGRSALSHVKHEPGKATKSGLYEAGGADDLRTAVQGSATGRTGAHAKSHGAHAGNGTGAEVKIGFVTKKMSESDVRFTTDVGSGMFFCLLPVTE